MIESEELDLIAAGSGPMVMPHHIMRMNVPGFDLSHLARPLSMKRLKEEKKESVDFNKFKKKKSMVKYWTTDNDVVLDGKEMGKGALVTSKDSTFSDPDRLDWVLADADQREFVGKLQGGQRSNFVLFVSTRDGFKVIPVQKWYKFTQRRKQKILTLEEAEERMKSKGRKSLAAGKDRWTMHGNKEPNWRMQLMEAETAPEITKKTKTEDLDDLGMDYEVDFADDEEINFGEFTDAGEATKRMHKTGWVAGDNERSSRPVKFARTMGAEEVDDYGPGNPYWSDVLFAKKEEEVEALKVEVQLNSALEKAKKKSKVQEKTDPPTETQKRASSVPATEDNPSKRPKIDDSNPPPPSAEQVMKQKRREESKKMRSSRGTSNSPAPTTPQMESTESECGLSDDLFLEIVKAKSNEFTIPELILDLTSHGLNVHSPDLQRRMKKLMRKYLNHNKATHTLTIKT